MNEDLYLANSHSYDDEPNTRFDHFQQNPRNREAIVYDEDDVIENQGKGS